MSTLYGKYLSMLGLVTKLSYLLFQMRGISAPPLLDYLKLICKKTFHE